MWVYPDEVCSLLEKMIVLMKGTDEVLQKFQKE